MTNCFEMGRPRRGMLAGLEPLVDRAFGIAGCGQVVGEEFRLAFDEIGEMLLQHCRNARVQLLAPGSQQGAIGCVLHQRVLKEIGRLRCAPCSSTRTGMVQPHSRIDAGQACPSRAGARV